MRGKPQVFSDKENDALREELRKLRVERKLSQREIGDLLSVGQPTAGKLLGARHAGMARATANALAKALGFRDAEQLLLERGVLAIMQEIPAGKAWGTRDAAVRIAQQHMQIEQAAIEAVVARYQHPDYRTRPMKWWIRMFLHEELEIQAARATGPIPIPAASSLDIPAETKPRARGRRRAT